MWEILGVVAATFLFSEFIGYVIHRLAHWPKSGPLYRKHLIHHFQAYPPHQMISEKYVGDLSTSFIPYFTPIFLLMIVGAYVFLPWTLFLPAWITMATVSLVNNHLHDSFHVKGHWLKRFAWHRRLSKIHFVHHHNVKRNLGIYWYGFDRLTGNFRTSSAREPAGPSPSPAASLPPPE